MPVTQEPGPAMNGGMAQGSRVTDPEEPNQPHRVGVHVSVVENNAAREGITLESCLARAQQTIDMKCVVFGIVVIILGAAVRIFFYGGSTSGLTFIFTAVGVIMMVVAAFIFYTKTAGERRSPEHPSYTSADGPSVIHVPPVVHVPPVIHAPPASGGRDSPPPDYSSVMTDRHTDPPPPYTEAVADGNREVRKE